MSKLTLVMKFKRYFVYSKYGMSLYRKNNGKYVYSENGTKNIISTYSF